MSMKTVPEADGGGTRGVDGGCTGGADGGGTGDPAMDPVANEAVTKALRLITSSVRRAKISL